MHYEGIKVWKVYKYILIVYTKIILKGGGKMNISQNIKRLRKVHGYTQRELAQILNVRPTAVSAWESGRNKPLMDKVTIMSTLFNVSTSEIVGDSVNNDINLIYNKLNNKRQKCVYNFAKAQLEDQKGKSNNLFEMHRSFHEIKLAGIVSAGTGEFQTDDASKETITYYGTIPAHDYALRVNGDSMSPMLENHQIIFVRKSNGAELHTGQIIVAMLNGDSYVKKIDLNNNCVKLVSLNPKYKPIRVTPTDKFMVQGVVLL